MRARFGAFLRRAVSRLAESAFKDAMREGARQTIHGIPVVVGPGEERQEVLTERVTAALDLIAEHDPRRLSQMQSQLASILVWYGTAPAAGIYHSAHRVCALSSEFVGRPGMSPVRIAMTLVHEAEHARIRQRGGKRTVSRYQEEWLCTGAEVAFARRVPGAEDIADQYGRRLEQISEIYSPAAELKRHHDAAREMGVPEWVLRFFRWLLGAPR